MHSVWVFFLWAMQTRQIMSDLTTNEAMNQYRYDYLRHGSPWDQGCIQNLINFYWSDKTDWAKVFTLPKLREWA